MKKLIFGLLSALLLSACALPNLQPPAQMQVTNFEECIKAGNPVMESYPRQCRHDEKTYVEQIDIPAPVPAEPTSDPAPDLPTGQKPCTKEYRPVCGKIQVQCIRAPCPPLDTTFSNRCEAENAGATDIREGACVDENPDPEGACLSFDGNWIPETRECEGMSREQCEKLGGTYNECASACRNDPNAEICTLQCVLVCQF
jgi:hypothetical protein